jgi:hypothetical protein
MKETIVGGDKYRRQYVALSDFRRRTVIAHGRDPQKVFATAIKKAYAHAAIVYAPAPDTVQSGARDPKEATGAPVVLSSPWIQGALQSVFGQARVPKFPRPHYAGRSE